MKTQEEIEKNRAEKDFYVAYVTDRKANIVINGGWMILMTIVIIEVIINSYHHGKISWQTGNTEIYPLAYFFWIWYSCVKCWYWFFPCNIDKGIKRLRKERRKLNKKILPSEIEKSGIDMAEILRIKRKIWNIEFRLNILEGENKSDDNNNQK